jgi:hypothetical protein
MSQLDKKSSKKSVPEGANGKAETAGSGIARSKMSKFKKIRGFLRGGSKRNKKDAATTKLPESPTKALLPTDEEDAASIYNVDIDDQSIASTAEQTRATDASTFLLGSNGEEQLNEDNDSFFAPARTSYKLKVVLLLMDPATRRFELLQLEFDSMKAIVSDVLAQIPLSVTEKSLRFQVYTGIVGQSGKELTSSQLLSGFCKGNDILVAIPQGYSASDSARLAHPILGDSRVDRMLVASGIDTNPWCDEAKKQKKGDNKSRKDVPTDAATAAPSIKSHSDFAEDTATEDSDATKESLASSFGKIVLWMGVVAVLAALHVYMSTPLTRGQVVPPGAWLSYCGLLPFDPECENAYLNVNFEGKVIAYNSNRDVAWEMQGDVCAAQAGSCVRGLELRDNGLIFVGGKRIRSIRVPDKSVSITPWPFAEKPHLKISRK